MNDSYDSPWKDALHDFLQPFLAFFFPTIEAEIDWSMEVEFLETELRKSERDAEVGLRTVDVLARVQLLQGQQTFLWIHVEVQSQRDEDFQERMLVCHYRLRDRVGGPVLSLGILGDDSPNWRPSRYLWEFLGCRLEFRFPVVKLLDYRSRLETLERDSNPFAVLVAAHLWTQDTRNDQKLRMKLKFRLVRSLFRRGLEKAEIMKLLRLVDWMLRLEPPYALQFQEMMALYEREEVMPYVTSWEQFGIEKGLEQGRQEGRQEGVLALQGVIAGILSRRFGHLSASVTMALSSLDDLERLGQISVEAASVDSLEEFEAVLGRPPN